MTRSTLLLITLLLLLGMPVAAQVNDTYVIPAAGNSPGAHGTRWQTQFSVFNPQSYLLTVSVVYIPSGGSQGLEQLIDLPANSLAYSDNILLDLFGVAGTGSLLVATFPEDNPGVPDNVVSRAFLVTTNTYNNSRSGTFGQTIPGVWAGLQDDGLTAVVHNIRNVSRLGWRTNFGAVNLGRRNVTVWLTIYDADGKRVHTAPFGLPPLAHLQQGLPIEIDRGTIEFELDDPSQTAVVFPYASTVDQLSGDPTYHSPVLLATPAAVFSKTGMPIDPTAVGKKLDSSIAREVRANARRFPGALLIRDESGYRITK